MKCMTFVMGKLSAKGVFHNTLLFSGRFLVSLSEPRRLYHKKTRMVADNS